MAADSDDPLTKAFKVRFGFAGNHTLGNLMLSTLEVTSGSFPEAIDICERMLNARGHVYPSTLDRVTLVAKTRDGRTLEGQATANHSRTALKRIALESASGIRPYKPALDVIRKADIIVLGPGSLFTSIISCLIVPGVIDAIAASRAKVAFVCSLADFQGETRGMTVRDHYEAVLAHGMGGLVDYALLHDERFDEGRASVARRPVLSADDVRAIEQAGTRVLLRDLADEGRSSWHDPLKLRHAFAEVLS